MKCNNCGAEIDEHVLVCPYCGYENEIEAQRRQDAYIHDLDVKKRDLAYEPEKKANKAQKSVGKITLIVGLILVVCIGVYGIQSYIKTKTGYAKQVKEIEKLEALYNAKDYTGMHEYFDTLNKGYGSSYEKYSRIDRLEHGVSYALNNLSEDKKFLSQGVEAVDVVMDLKYIFDELKDIQTYEQEEFRFEEQEGVLYYKDLYIHELKTVGMLSDEEIENAMDLEDYTELANTVKSRWGY